MVIITLMTVTVLFVIIFLLIMIEEIFELGILSSGVGALSNTYRVYDLKSFTQSMPLFLLL